MQSRFISKYLKLESLRDTLFQADCQHIDNPTTGDANTEETREADHCSHCDRTKIIQRKPRGMCVHYGHIASSTQVIKHAPTRDKINTRLGGKVLCFETEAAEVVFDFPCLVIRGISDYADAHGNSAWQKHAAFAAATFAKELLLYIPAQEIEQMPTIQGKLSCIS
jgi:nucleoside phosphorylase